MKNTAAVQRKPPEPTPARAKLAELIGELRELTRRADELRAAPPGGVTRPAREARDAAAAVLAQAKADGAARLLGRPVEGPAVSITTARAELQDAEDNLAAAELAQADLDAQERDLPDAMRNVRQRIEEAAVDVIRQEGATAVAMLVAETAELQRRLLAAVGGLRALRSMAVFTETEMRAAVSLVTYGLVFHGHESELNAAMAASPVAAAWRDVHAALQRDADAVVPEG